MSRIKDKLGRRIVRKTNKIYKSDRHIHPEYPDPVWDEPPPKKQQEEEVIPLDETAEEEVKSFLVYEDSEPEEEPETPKPKPKPKQKPKLVKKRNPSEKPAPEKKEPAREPQKRRRPVVLF